MVYLIAFVAACIVVPWLLALRRWMSVPFTALRFRIVDGQPPVGTADAFATATDTLATLGFAGPHWIDLFNADGADSLWPRRAIYLHATHDAHVVVAPTLDPDRNGPLAAVVVTRLADGPTLLTTAFETTAKVMADRTTRVRVVAEHDLATLVRDHATWRATFAAADAPPVTIDALVAREMSEIVTRIDTGIAEGRLRRDDDGEVRARLPLAWRLLWATQRRPAPRAPQPIVATSHLVLIAHVVEAINGQAPPRRVQLGFLAFSIGVSLALGAWWWNATFAAMLLGVILVHELGHYLAMRAFGYRDVHMLALPLVGGVTMGQDADPRADRQAWMSLMGPLPGIVIGWLLLAWQLGVVGSDPPSWVAGAAIAFLVINYFNLLPMAGLDGAHVVTAMLPPRQAWLRGVVFVGLSLAGIAFGLAIGEPLIVGFSVAVAFGAHGAFALARAARRVDVAPSDWHAMPIAARTEAALRACEASAGPPRANLPRLAQALALRRLFDTRPMTMVQRAAIGVLYVAVIAVPVVFVGSIVGAWTPKPGDLEARAAMARERHAAADARWRPQATAIALPALFDALCDPATPAAGPAAIAAAQARLGVTFDDALAALYRRCDGTLYTGVAPLAQLARHDAVDTELVGGLMPPEPGDVPIHAARGAPEDEHEPTSVVPRAAFASWLVIADAGEMESLVHWVPSADPHAALAGHVVECSYACFDHGPFEAWLREQWIARQVSLDLLRDYESRVAQARAALADADVATLVAVADATATASSSFAGLLHRIRTMMRGASHADIAAAEARLGRALPPALREAYAIRDGIAPWRLGPVADITPMQGEPLPDAAFVTDADAAAAAKPVPAETLRACIRIGGAPNSTDEAMRAYFRATPLLWCPDAPDAAHRILDLASNRGFRSVRAWLVDAAARDRTRRLP